MDIIRFNVPFVAGNELENIGKVFSGGHFAGNGPFTNLCQDWLQDYLGAPRVLLTHSCTGALEMSAILTDLEPGDEVIMPSFTFTTTASSFMRSGASPVFCEIDPATMLLDLDDAEMCITPQTKAIVPVHYAGCSLDMHRLLSIADANGLTVIEDAAQGLGSNWKGAPLGTFAPLAAISFHETKNIHSGLGGCLVINNPDLIDRAEVVWERGTDRSAFFRGLVDKYTWREVGSSFYPTEFQAAFLYAQLMAMDGNLEKRHNIWESYESRLSDLDESGLLRILKQSVNNDANAHMFAVILPTQQICDELRAYLNYNGVEAVIHYVPLHQSSVGSELGYSESDLPLTADLAARILRLPLHHEIGDSDISKISRLIHDFF